MQSQELRARLFSELDNMGFPCRLSYRYYLNRPVKGFKVVVLDLAIMDLHGKPIFAFYIGKVKARRIMKYGFTKLPYLKIEDRDSLKDILKEFTGWALSNYEPLKNSASK
jgi:hypothetical protein